MSAKIVKELLTRWTYKVDTKQLAQASRMIKKLKKDQIGIKKSSTAFARGEVANVKLMTRAWGKLNKQVKTYGGKRTGGGKGGKGGFGGMGAGGSGSLPFLIGRLAGSNALTSALFAGPKVVAGLAILKSISLAADREETVGKFRALLGGKGKGAEAEALMDTLSDFAKKTPFGIRQVRTLAGTLLASGFKAGELTDVLRMIGSFVGADNEKLQRVLFNFAEIRRKGYADKVDLKQFTRAEVPIIAALQKTLGIEGADFDRFVRAGKITSDLIEKSLKMMTSKGGQFFGLLEMMNKSVRGKASELGDEIILFAEAFGKLLTPVTKKILDELIKLMGVANRVLSVFINLWNGFNISPFLIGLVDGFKFLAGVGVVLLAWLNPVIALLGMMFLMLEDFFVFLSGGDSILGSLLDFDWGMVWDGLAISFQEQWDKIAAIIQGNKYSKFLFDIVTGARVGAGGESDLLEKTDVTSIDPGSMINQSMEFNQQNTINGVNQPASELIASLSNDGFRLMNMKAQPAFVV